MYCTAQGIQLLFCNNFTWSIIYKNFESLCCTPETNIILQINYTSIKKKKNLRNFSNQPFKNQFKNQTRKKKRPKYTQSKQKEGNKDQKPMNLKKEK